MPSIEFENKQEEVKRQEEREGRNERKKGRPKVELRSQRDVRIRRGCDITGGKRISEGISNIHDGRRKIRGRRRRNETRSW